MSKNSVGRVDLDLNINKKGFNSQLGGIGSAAKKLGGVFVAAFSVKAVANFAASCVKLGSDLQEVQNVVDVSFPTMSKKVNDFARNAAVSFGLSETMAKKYMGTTGAMAKAFGFTEKEAFNMGATITGLAGDMASFYNMNQDEAFTKLKGIFTGETEALKDVGVVMTQANLDQYALANGYNKTTSAMTEQEKVALRYKFVQQQLSLASGDFIRTSGSWANQVRILKLQFDGLKASIGQGLINLLTPLLQMINLLMHKLTELASKFKQFTERLMGKSPAGDNALTAAAGSAYATADAVSGVGDAASTTGKKIKKAARELMGFDKITKLSDKPDASSGLSGLGAGVSSIADFTASEEEAKKSSGLFSKIYKKYKTNIDRLKKAFGNFREVLGDYFIIFYEKVLKPLGKWAMNKLAPVVIDMLAPVVIDMLAVAFQFLAEVLKFLKPIFVWLLDNVIIPLAKRIGKWLLDRIQDITLAFKFMGKAVKWVVTKFKEFKKWIKDKFKLPKLEVPTIDNIKDAISNKWDEAKEWWDGEKEELKDVAVKVIKTVMALKDAAFDKVSTAWEKIKTSTVVKSISGATKSAFTTIKNAWNAIKTGTVTKWIEGKKKDGWATIKSIWDSLKTKTITVTLKLKTIVDSLKGWINKNIVDKINDAVPGTPIPRLAQGGYVKRNTPQLAMIGDNRRYGEVVAPENKLLEMARQAAAMSGGGSNQEVVRLLRELLAAIKALKLDVYMSGREVTDIVTREINARTRATGVSPINV